MGLLCHEAQGDLASVQVDSNGWARRLHQPVPLSAWDETPPSVEVGFPLRHTMPLHAVCPLWALRRRSTPRGASDVARRCPGISLSPRGLPTAPR